MQAQAMGIENEHTTAIKFSFGGNHQEHFKVGNAK